MTACTFRARCEYAHPPPGESSPPSLAAGSEGILFRKKNEEVTERAGAEVTARTARTRAAETGKEAVARTALRAAATELLQKLPARALSAAQACGFRSRKPCFNCRFIFRQTGCLHLRSSQHPRLFERKAGSSPTLQARPGAGVGVECLGFKGLPQRGGCLQVQWLGRTSREDQEAGASATRLPPATRPSLQLIPLPSLACKHPGGREAQMRGREHRLETEKGISKL